MVSGCGHLDCKLVAGTVFLRVLQIDATMRLAESLNSAVPKVEVIRRNETCQKMFKVLIYI